MSVKNLYHRRLVDQSNAKACWICYRLSATVLITPVQDDWFHICASHLTDRNFATAKDAEEHAKRKRDEELKAEQDAIVKEYAEKQRLKLEKRKGKDKVKDKDAKKKAGEKAQDEADEKEKQEKLAELEKKKADGDGKTDIDGPRIFELSKTFFNMRLQKKRDIEQAKANRTRLQDPKSFPTVPTGKPGAS